MKRLLKEIFTFLLLTAFVVAGLHTQAVEITAKNTADIKNYDIRTNKNLLSSWENQERKVKKKVKRVIKKYVDPSMNRWEKMKVIHDWMINHITYDYQNYLNGTIPPVSYTPYGALIKGKSVCEGYARSFGLLMDTMKIPCKIVSSGTHSWNMVKINKSWYHIDVTWDDPSKDNARIDGLPMYDYFLKSTAKFQSLGKDWGKTHLITTRILFFLL